MVLGLKMNSLFKINSFCLFRYEPFCSHKKIIAVLIHHFQFNNLADFPQHLQNIWPYFCTWDQITLDLKQWTLQIWSEVLTSTNEQMSRCSLPQHTFIWVRLLWPVLCLYVLSFQGGCSGFELVLLFSLSTGMAAATFDGWLNTKTLLCILRGSRETVSLASVCAFESRLTMVDRRMIF